ncbi:ATP-binding protein [Spirillospora sp. CA-255316]
MSKRCDAATAEGRVLGAVTLPGETASVGVFRRFVADIIGTYCPVEAERVDDAVLLSSETVTNSVVHSDSRHGGVVTLTLRTSGRVLRVEVLDDGGKTMPRRCAEDALRANGRGVLLVEALAKSSGHSVDAEGRLLSWFEI